MRTNLVYESTALLVAIVALACMLLVLGRRIEAENKPTQIICEASTEVALHETEPMYPAWEYTCSGGVKVVIVD
jgi:hypothetical protein